MGNDCIISKVLHADNRITVLIFSYYEFFLVHFEGTKQDTFISCHHLKFPAETFQLDLFLTEDDKILGLARISGVEAGHTLCHFLFPENDIGAPEMITYPIQPVISGHSGLNERNDVLYYKAISYTSRYILLVSQDSEKYDWRQITHRCFHLITIHPHRSGEDKYMIRRLEAPSALNIEDYSIWKRDRFELDEHLGVIVHTRGADLTWAANSWGAFVIHYM